MNEIKALEKLRNTIVTYAADCDERWMLAACDDIEAEITDRFMLLPVDADDVPIHVGDVVVAISTGEFETVSHVSEKSIEIERFGVKSSSVRHIKPRTLEDVLTEFGIAAARELNADPDGYGISDKTIAKCVSEIHELLGSDAE